jgi:hypothetical protein
MKRAFYILAAALAIMASACFSPWKGDEATLTLHFGGNAAVSRASTDMSHCPGATESRRVVLPASSLLSM